MANSSSVPKTPSPSTSLPYTDLVRFLVTPFLDSPESLKVDCELSAGKTKVWIRMAIEGEDKGRVFGRGGRNIQAIRTVLEAAAKIGGQSLYLDIYGSQTQKRESPSPSRSPSSKPSRSSESRSSGVSRPSSRPRSQGQGS